MRKLFRKTVKQKTYSQYKAHYYYLAIDIFHQQLFSSGSNMHVLQNTYTYILAWIRIFEFSFVMPSNYVLGGAPCDVLSSKGGFRSMLKEQRDIQWWNKSRKLQGKKPNLYFTFAFIRIVKYSLVDLLPFPTPFFFVHLSIFIRVKQKLKKNYVHSIEANV